MATGLAAGPGAASGKVVFSATKAEEWANRGEKVVLARIETSPEDLRGMIASEGILTGRGGVSSHAALVARQMGKVCVAGAGDIHIDYHAGTLTCQGHTLREGDAISINGSTGEVFYGAIKTADSELKQVLIGKTLKPGESEVFKYFNFMMKLADKYRKLGHSHQRRSARPGGKRDRIRRRRHRPVPHRAHVLRRGPDHRGARNDSCRTTWTIAKQALAKLLPLQQGDFEGIFRALAGRPACIRLLDPPLHEFLPQHDNPRGQHEVAEQLGISVETVNKRVHELHEFNPMLGFRGCRLGIKYPGNHRDAGPRDFPGRRRRAEGRRQGAAGSDGAAGRLQARTRLAGRRSSTAWPAK